VRHLFINIDGLRINYIDEGEGDNVLLLHGWGANIETMLPIAKALKDRYRVLAIDLPGFGLSDSPKIPWNSFNYADIVKKFIDILSLKDINLIGHSHGGRVSIILSSKYKDMVKKLILIDSAGLISKKNVKYYYKVLKYKLYKKVYFFINKNNESKLEKFYKKFGSQDYQNAGNTVMRETLVKVLHDNIENRLSMIKVPTLIIWGENDTDTPIYMAEKLNKKIADSALIVLEKAGHYSYLYDFYKFRLIMDSFLDS
jgi:pimeloyl-ACP methyl ester carboxylesterase